MMQPAHPVHSPEVTTSSYRCAQCGFSGGTRPPYCRRPDPEPRVVAGRLPGVRSAPESLRWLCDRNTACGAERETWRDGSSEVPG